MLKIAVKKNSKRNIGKNEHFYIKIVLNGSFFELFAFFGQKHSKTNIDSKICKFHPLDGRKNSSKQTNCAFSL
jgi:hypothetical protein